MILVSGKQLCTNASLLLQVLGRRLQSACCLQWVCTCLLGLTTPRSCIRCASRAWSVLVRCQPLCCTIKTLLLSVNMHLLGVFMLFRRQGTAYAAACHP